MLPVDIQVGDISFGAGHVYVGNLPGLAMIGGIGDEASPAAVLGLDSLTRMHRMILRVSDNEAWFQPKEGS
jgi:hypothetical protein